jgi:hypothetical protein
MKLLGFMFVALIGLGGCPPAAVTPLPDASDAVAPPPAPVVDGGAIGDAPTPQVDAGPVTTDCASACAALLKAGCSLGDAGDCPAFLTRVLGSGKVPDPALGKPLTCAIVETVKTKADVQKLGFVCAP